VSNDRNYNLSYINIDLNYSTKLLKGQALNILLISSLVDTFGHNSARYSFYFGQGMDILPVWTHSPATAGACSSSSATKLTDPGTGGGVGRSQC